MPTRLVSTDFGESRGDVSQERQTRSSIVTATFSLAQLLLYAGLLVLLVVYLFGDFFNAGWRILGGLGALTTFIGAVATGVEVGTGDLRALAAEQVDVQTVILDTLADLQQDSAEDS